MIPKQPQNKNQKKKKVVRQPQAKKSKQPAPRPSPAIYHMTPCGRDYFRALNFPFDLNLAPCIPAAMPLPSQKFVTTSRGSFRTNAAGAGGIALFPARGFCSDLQTSAGAFAPFIIGTNPAWPGSNVDYSFLNQSVGTSGVGVWTGLDLYAGAASPYVSAAFGVGTARSMKVVASGLRIRYTGPIVNMGGRVISWRNPQNTAQVAATQDGIQQFLANNAAATSRTTDQWFELNYRPIIEADLAPIDQPGNPAHYGNNSLITNRLALAFLVEDLPSSSFEFEAVAYYEATGPGIPTTPSHADPQTLSMVLSATPVRVDPDPATSRAGAVRQLLDTVRQAGYQGVQGLGERVGALLNSMGPREWTAGARYATNYVLSRRANPRQQLLQYQ